MSVSDKLLLRKRAVYQCTKNTGYTAYSILNSSNSRYIILPKLDGIVQVRNTLFQANNLTQQHFFERKNGSLIHFSYRE